jgi:hypothetical protein
VIRDYGMLKEHGAMPVAGGVLDQSPTFIDAVEVIDDELVTLRKAKQPKE